MLLVLPQATLPRAVHDARLRRPRNPLCDALARNRRGAPRREPVTRARPLNRHPQLRARRFAGLRLVHCALVAAAVYARTASHRESHTCAAGNNCVVAVVPGQAAGVGPPLRDERPRRIDLAHERPPRAVQHLARDRGPGEHGPHGRAQRAGHRRGRHRA